MPCLFWALVVIIILLLNVISTEQKAKIKELLRIKIVYLFAEIISACLLWEIYIRVYIYILISPELLVGRKFYKTLINPTFRVHVGLVVINKVYFIANSGGLFWSLYI